MSSQAVEFRRRKNLASEDCAFIYSLRKCKASLNELIEIAEKDRNPECLYHLMTCDDCRTHVQERDPNSSEAEKIPIILAAINRMEEGLEQQRDASSSRTQRRLRRASMR